MSESMQRAAGRSWIDAALGASLWAAENAHARVAEAIWGTVALWAVNTVGFPDDVGGPGARLLEIEQSFADEARNERLDVSAKQKTFNGDAILGRARGAQEAFEELLKKAQDEKNPSLRRRGMVLYMRILKDAAQRCPAFGTPGAEHIETLRALTLYLADIEWLAEAFTSTNAQEESGMSAHDAAKNAIIWHTAQNCLHDAQERLVRLERKFRAAGPGL